MRDLTLEEVKTVAGASHQEDNPRREDEISTGDDDAPGGGGPANQPVFDAHFGDGSLSCCPPSIDLFTINIGFERIGHELTVGRVKRQFETDPRLSEER